MQFKLTEVVNDEPLIYMNTWANYNENGADLSKYGINSISDGWLTPEEALAFAEEHEEDEPFINDTMNIPFNVDENAHVEEVIDKIERYNALDGQEKEVVQAYLEAESDDFDLALECAESGDYEYYPGLNSYTDLAYEICDELGGPKELLGDRVSAYIDGDMLKRDMEIEFDDSDLRAQAADYVEEEFGSDNDYLEDIESMRFDLEELKDQLDDEDLSQEDKDEILKEYEEKSKIVKDYDDKFEERVEDYVDEHRDDYIESYFNDYMELAEQGELGDDFYETYLDYEALGRDLSYDGYTITDKGIIRLL